MDWWGHSATRGWVLLDRNIPCNAAGVKNKLLFIECDKECAFFESWDQWTQPIYMAKEQYLSRLNETQREEALNKLSKLQEKLDLFRELSVYAFYESCSGNNYNPFGLAEGKPELYTVYSAAWSKKKSEQSHNAHREFIRKIGKAYKGTSKISEAKKHRTTHCYNCHRKLDNSIDLECIACKWIICTCGACGCGWNGHYC